MIPAAIAEGVVRYKSVVLIFNVDKQAANRQGRVGTATCSCIAGQLSRITYRRIRDRWL
jgi:hypothetical protein